ncbi:MAG: site-2 protease family protein [bacterium]|nr:site-2 protease family protein [bacterium]
MLWQMLGLIKSPLLLVMFVVLMIFPLLFSIAFHELAHGWTADKLGDPTPRLMGRLTLNPFKHLDPMGTIMMFLVGLGWAKPVVVNMRNIPNPTHQMLVALAGPASNFLLALVFATIISLCENNLSIPTNHLVIMFLDIIVTINLGLGVFNLLPIPPMDGSRIVAWLLPARLEYEYMKLQPYGMFILMVILVFNGFVYVFYAANFLKFYLYNLLQVA